ncbi:NAD(P)/FAD-dependent oxidoreductase, partial [Nocardioides sp.]|uniref:NAD(P)/FAD-dependent oxidoreductase n=1 Tax=Nocardioides sp. TaxID=35761 RepID=UPI002732D21F
LVIDAGHPRNAPAGHLHNYLSREGLPPADLLAEGRAEVAAYGGEIVRGTAVAAEPTEAPGFEVRLESGAQVVAHRLLVATGLVDVLPEVTGLRERWGRDVLHCPYCHGWEVRDQRIVVLGTGPMACHHALLWSLWTSDVTLVVHQRPELAPDELARLAARGVRVVDGPVVGVQTAQDRLTGVHLSDGTAVAADALVAGPRFTVESPLLTSLHLEPEDFMMGPHSLGTHIPADPTGATAVPGVWVAGNVTGPADIVISAAAAGVRAGGMINMDLVTEEVDRAVQDRALPA